jgi:hypothetical protein
MQAKDSPKSLNQKEEAQWNTSCTRLPKTEVPIKPIIPQNLSIILNNRIMSMEHIFQYINKHMLETIIP